MIVSTQIVQIYLLGEMEKLWILSWTGLLSCLYRLIAGITETTVDFHLVDS